VRNRRSIERLSRPVRALRRRQRDIETRLERRVPALYDARHAATGVGRALWPLFGPLLMLLIIAPIVAALAALLPALGLEITLPALPSPDLPDVDLPEVNLPDVTTPAWLQAIGAVIGAVLSALADVAKYVFIAGALALGVRRTLQVRRRRAEAERLGRTELLRRLTTALSGVEVVARERAAARVGDVRRSVPPTEPAG
jgi:hypothetical protein